jgi:alpha-beta hydrolase superfamily lysophospholipase
MSPGSSQKTFDDLSRTTCVPPRPKPLSGSTAGQSAADWDTTNPNVFPHLRACWLGIRLALPTFMQTPILMVHGMCCTGQVWTQFRSFFEARGARVYAPTLRPLDRVGIHERPHRALANLSLNDYVTDLEEEVRRIQHDTGLMPAVIGHSMGGLLAQALAERQRISAAVLISPASPAGVRTLNTQVFWATRAVLDRFGWNAPMIRPRRRTTDFMVMNVMPPNERAAALDSMVWESGRAFDDFANFPVDETRIRVPLLTIAAGRDRLVPAKQVRRTAAKYAAVGGEFRAYPQHGHWLYAEPGWELAAADIYDWLERATLRSPALRDARNAAEGAVQPQSDVV